MTEYMTRGKGLNIQFTNNTIGTGPMSQKIPSQIPSLNPNPNLNLDMEMSGEEFCKLMERYHITAAMLGIDTTYKYKLCRNQRKPSKELVARLLRIIERIEAGEKALKEHENIEIDERARSLAGRTPPSRGGDPGFKSPRAHLI